MARKCTNWLAKYIEFTSMSEAPQEYHLWVGLTIVSAVLKRQVYRDRKKFITWPNLYTFLVGPPGTKKSSAINIGEELVKQMQDPPYVIDTFHTAPFLVSTLAAVTAQYNPGRTPFLIIGDEAPAFFRRAKYAEDLIPLLIRMWDCKSGGAGGTQLRGLENVINPYATGLWGVVPDILVDIMPPEVIRGGFASRVIWVYSDDTKRCFPFPEDIPDLDPEIEKSLVHDLNEMALLKGEFKLTDEAHKAYADWYTHHRTQVVNTVDDPRRIGYANRKGEMIFKVMMLLSVIEGDSLLVEERHFDAAVDMIEMLEPHLAKVYQATAKSAQYVETVDKIRAFIIKKGGKANRSEVTKYCYNNGIMLQEQDVALVQLGAEGWLRDEVKGRVLWYVKN
jgi:hypothetical protein